MNDFEKAYQRITGGKVDTRLQAYCEDIWNAAIASMQGEAVAMHLACTSCHAEHVDEGEWSKRKHKTHQCQKCGHEWRPFEFATVGVPSSASAEIARLTKELEEARKDAERYRMMRSLDVTPYEKWNKAQKALHRAMNSADTVEMVDAAVDAAISKIGGGE